MSYWTARRKGWAKVATRPGRSPGRATTMSTVTVTTAILSTSCYLHFLFDTNTFFSLFSLFSFFLFLLCSSFILSGLVCYLILPSSSIFSALNI